MKQLLTFAELAALPSGTKVCRIQDGQIQLFYIGVFLSDLRVLCLVTGTSVQNAISIHQSSSVCHKNLAWVTGYDSEKMGEIMIAQLEWQIEGIKDTYFNH